MKTYGRVEVYLHISSTSTLDEGELLAISSGRFIPEERAPSTHWIGGWMDSRAGLDTTEKFLPCRESNPDRPARNLVTILTDLPRFRIFPVTFHNLSRLRI